MAGRLGVGDLPFFMAKPTFLSNYPQGFPENGGPAPEIIAFNILDWNSIRFAYVTIVSIFLKRSPTEIFYELRISIRVYTRPSYRH